MSKNTAAKKGAAAAKAPERKEKKLTIATEIFQKLLPRREKLSKKDFRALVISEMGRQMGLSNPGTLGMYFSVSDALVTGRKFKKYNRVSNRAPNRTEEEKTLMANEAAAARAKKKADKEAARKAIAEASKGKVPSIGVEPALNALANEAFDQIAAVADQARHNAEIIRHSAAASMTVKKAARKASAKKTTATKKPAAKKAATTKKPAAKKATASKKTTAKKA
jgi:hypothetical protein